MSADRRSLLYNLTFILFKLIFSLLTFGLWGLCKCIIYIVDEINHSLSVCDHAANIHTYVGK